MTIPIRIKVLSVSPLNGRVYDREGVPFTASLCRLRNGFGNGTDQNRVVLLGIEVFTECCASVWSTFLVHVQSNWFRLYEHYKDDAVFFESRGYGKVVENYCYDRLTAVMEIGSHSSAREIGGTEMSEQNFRCYD